MDNNDSAQNFKRISWLRTFFRPARGWYHEYITDTSGKMFYFEVRKDWCLRPTDIGFVAVYRILRLCPLCHAQNYVQLKQTPSQ